MGGLGVFRGFGGEMGVWIGAVIWVTWHSKGVFMWLVFNLLLGMPVSRLG